jgi:hypothetical protein
MRNKQKKECSRRRECPGTGRAVARHGAPRQSRNLFQLVVDEKLDDCKKDEFGSGKCGGRRQRMERV